MDYQQAVAVYQKTPDKETLHDVARQLREEMTDKEKIYMLSGHPLKQIQQDMIKYGRNYNVHALPAGGCERLGVPPVLFTDGPRGVVMLNSTCFPVSSMRAASFDVDLEYRIGKAIADEAIAQGANYFAGICINLLRNPRWGRSQESYGEDQFVLGEFGAALTRSVQEEGMIACPKHFALNSIEDLRFNIDVKCDDKTLREVYLPHFKKCIDAGAWSIMGAYNRYDEFYCCGNKKLLTDILRDEWGFDGFVMSDFVWGVRETEDCLRSGLDVEMMFTQQYSESKIKKCIKAGKLNMEHVDRAVENVLKVLIAQVPKIKERPLSVVGCEEHRQLALEAAKKGMVLLKNNGVLPLSKDAKLIACGPYANEENVGDHGSSQIYDKDVTKPVDGLKTVFSNVTLDGEGDVAVVYVGSNSNEEGEYFSQTKYSLEEKPKNSGGDRASLHLSDRDISIIKEMKQKGKKVIVVLYSGSAIITQEWKEYADAIIMNHYSGCRGAVALAQLLAGEAEFTGRLPYTVAVNEEDYPPIIGIGQKPYVIEYGYYHGYALFDKTKKPVEYPFGYGLSYSSYEISDPKVTMESDGGDGRKIAVDVTVKNTGKMDGAQVVFVFAGSNRTDVDRPHKQLKGFARVELAAGEEKRITIPVSVDDLKFYDDKRWELDPSYTFYVGSDAADAESRTICLDM